MQLGITTDFLRGTGKPEKYLRLIADAGFTHINWCHQWNTDFIYSRSEITRIGRWLKEYGLQLQDIHASAGVEKLWFSGDEYARRAGVELITNRIRMFAQLGGTGALALHGPSRMRLFKWDNSNVPQEMLMARRSMDELMPVLEKYQAVIAIENMRNDFFECIEVFTAAYPEKHLGITYDSGHGNYGYGRGTSCLERNKSRLKALHLNDNDGTLDRHQTPFYGTVDWEKLAAIIAGSAYSGPLSFELSMRYMPHFTPGIKEQPEEKIREFLTDAREKCAKVAEFYRKFKAVAGSASGNCAE